MDCFVLPNDEASGELVHFGPNQCRDFRSELEPGFFAALDGLLSRLTPSAERTTSETKMVIGRLRDTDTQFFKFVSAANYTARSQESEIWSLVDAFYRKRLQCSASAKNP